MGNSSPIGLIDSGIGGFTVLRELQRQLPRENIVYLGDAKRMPYGERENEEIIAFGNSDIRFLENMGVKAILLACNTISSLIESLDANVPLFSIVAVSYTHLDVYKRQAYHLFWTAYTAPGFTQPLKRCIIF